MPNNRYNNNPSQSGVSSGLGASSRQDGPRRSAQPSGGGLGQQSTFAQPPQVNSGGLVNRSNNPSLANRNAPAKKGFFASLKDPKKQRAISDALLQFGSIISRFNDPEGRMPITAISQAAPAVVGAFRGSLEEQRKAGLRDEAGQAFAEGGTPAQRSGRLAGISARSGDIAGAQSGLRTQQALTPQAKKQEGFTLSQGQERFGVTPEGDARSIASVPAAQKETKEVRQRPGDSFFNAKTGKTRRIPSEVADPKFYQGNFYAVNEEGQTVKLPGGEQSLRNLPPNTRLLREDPNGNVETIATGVITKSEGKGDDREKTLRIRKQIDADVERSATDLFKTEKQTKQSSTDLGFVENPNYDESIQKARAAYVKSEKSIRRKEFKVSNEERKAEVTAGRPKFNKEYISVMKKANPKATNKEIRDDYIENFGPIKGK